jgi:uncharacterized protein (DUF697 family)
MTGSHREMPRESTDSESFPMGEAVTQAVDVKEPLEAKEAEAAQESAPAVAEAVEQPWDRKRVAMSLVNRHAAMAAGAGLIPVVAVDVVALTGIELNLIKRLCDLYGVKFTRQLGLNIVASLLAGTVPVALLTMTASFVKLIPGLGQLAGSAAMAVNGGAIIYAIGCVMVRHFESGGDLLNFDAKQAKVYFKQQVEAQRSNPNPEWAKQQTGATAASTEAEPAGAR